MDISILRGLVTAALFVLFIALFVWAFSRKRKADFDEAAALPLGEGTDPQSDRTSKGEV